MSRKSEMVGYYPGAYLSGIIYPISLLDNQDNGAYYFIYNNNGAKIIRLISSLYTYI